MRSFMMTSDAMGVASPVLVPSDHIVAVQLAPGLPKTVNAPAEATLVLFSATAPFWAKIGAAAAVPTGDILDGSAPELNPVGRTLAGATLIGLAAAQACTVNLVFYR